MVEMIGARSPISLVEQQSAALVGHLPGVRDGNDVATHDARVLTRRLRETLAIARGELTRDGFEHLSRIVKQAGRALGEARDHDVALELLKNLEAHAPSAAALFGPLHAAIVGEQRHARRDLVKTLEDLEVSKTARIAKDARRHAKAWFGNSAAWRKHLRQHVNSRADDVRAAMQHATGIYFPNRSHSTRIAIKKLRYALEVAEAAGMWRPARAARVLRKAQNALGRAHDCQVFIDRLRDLSSSGAMAPQLATDVAIPFLEAEIARLYDRYLGLREELTAICDACNRFAHRRSVVPALVAAGVGIPSLLLFTRPSARRAIDRKPADVVRVAIDLS
jgi:CHAD domain-containing protein